MKQVFVVTGSAFQFNIYKQDMLFQLENKGLLSTVNVSHGGTLKIADWEFIFVSGPEKLKGVSGYIDTFANFADHPDFAEIGMRMQDSRFQKFNRGQFIDDIRRKGGATWQDSAR